ncbi:DUF3131 domain-containing protein [Vibrio ponticus]|uniref:DUF3131 domain-containing protein n=1 Tax=Vibrio ponticus TaxID=265668 RepID=A0A3N3DZP9_9VIBR|nr:DUF3131 domain-containing protein [Vibrio ponticus]ROV59846.1 DUF3131 domain-containing protein [Vibrio ponticus]
MPPHRLLAMVLGSTASLPLFGLASESSVAEEISFYGQRSINASQHEEKSKQEFYRRAIAPVIAPSESDVGKDVEKTTKTHTPLIKASTQISLSRNELLLAKKAQHYIETNYRKETGLWDSVQGYPHTTMWDIGSGIGATLALEALELKTTEEVHAELAQTLATLQAIPLYKNRLPNREYNTKTALPSGKLSTSTSNGNGWSALDIGRLLIWLKILTQIHPEFHDQVLTIVDKWQLNQAIHQGTLFGTKLHKNKEYYRQEGRHGYLQYAANGFAMFDYQVTLPNLERFISTVKINGTNLEIDTRNVPFLTSDPYVLASIEFGQEAPWNQINTVYQLHKDKSKQAGTLYSYAEDAMSKNPWFAYNNLYYYGKPWTSVSPAGKVIENPQIFSHKVAMGFSVLFEDAFSQTLFATVLDNSLHARSVPTGTYENGGLNTSFNINTNSLVLVSLWYKRNGRQPIYPITNSNLLPSEPKNID